MALNTFTQLDPNADTFSDWLNKTNEIIDLLRTDVITANGSIANTDGDARINGMLGANTLVAVDHLRGGTPEANGTLIVSTNTVFANTADLVTVTNDLDVLSDLSVTSNTDVGGDSHFVGNVQIDSTLLVNGATVDVTVVDGVQTFRTESSNTDATLQTDAQGSILFNADANDEGNTGTISVSISGTEHVRVDKGGDITFLNANGGSDQVRWDASANRLGINKVAPTTALDINGTATANDLIITSNADINVAGINALTVNNTLAGNTTLTITTPTTFSSITGEVLVENDLRINNDLHYVLQPNNYVHLIPEVEGYDLGEANTRWDVFARNVDVSTQLVPSANGVLLGNTTQRFNLSATDGNFSGNVVVSGDVDVVGSVGTTDLIASGTVDAESILANNISVEGDVSSVAGSLSITSNVAHTGAEIITTGNAEVAGSLTVGTLVYTIDDNNYVDLIPTTTGDQLGNTTNRWDANLQDVDIAGNTTANMITVDTLDVTTNATLPSELTFGGNTTFENIEVSNTANINNLSVFGLVTNTAAIVGEVASISNTSTQVIDQFDKTLSGGFKYMIHGTNADASSTYIVELMCAHNSTEMFFTRYAELMNSFNIVLVPQINGANVELLATCDSAAAANVHSLNIVRIDTRDNQ